MQHILHLPLALPSVRLRAMLYMILASFCFSAVELVPQYLVQGMSLYQVVWGRYAVHLAFMIVVFGPRYKATLVTSSRLPLQIVRSLTMVMMPVCFIVALQYMPAHDIWAVYWTSPLVMLALSVLVLHEKAGRTRWLAAGVGFVAMLLIFRPSGAVLQPAAVLAFGVGLAISLHLMFSRILRHDHPLTSLFHTALWVFIIVSVIVPSLWVTPTLPNLIGIGFIGVVGMATLFLLARAGEIAPIPVVASLSYTEGIARVVINAVLFGLLPSRSALLGVVIIGALTAFLLWFETRRAQD